MRSTQKLIAVLALVAAVLAAGPAAAGGRAGKLDDDLARRAGGPGRSRVIIETIDGGGAADVIAAAGGRAGRRLRSFQGHVAVVPNVALARLARHPRVRFVHEDRPTGALLDLTSATVGSRLARTAYKFDGAGVGVAVIDSGIASWHDDLTYLGTDPSVRAPGGQRVAAFVDFVNGRTAPYDDFGHGTHVAGIIAGNGYDSLGARAGIAPAAHLVVLKVLDARGRGYISDVIAAIDYVLAHRDELNIRVVNLSVGAPVTQSYRTDPLALAVRRAVDAGVIVVAAAGNLGRSATGGVQRGAITAPGNAPWVITVGATNHMGTITRADDSVAPFSSRGPTAIDYAAKPDLVAPGTGTVSLAAPGSTLYTMRPDALVAGSVAAPSMPYLRLSGTSMAAPVVAGTVALMVQAYPQLTPNLAKAVLQYTAQVLKGQDYLTQGAGLLNTFGAVKLVRFFATGRATDLYPAGGTWSRALIWGNVRVTGGVIVPSAGAWRTGVVWGQTPLAGQNIVWGTTCGADRDCENIVWGTAQNIVWGTGENIVWGTGENIVWGTATAENIVWGTDSENIVWGTACGGADCENIVWGTTTTDVLTGQNIVWGTWNGVDSIVWGTGENIVWGTGENIVWGTSGGEEAAAPAGEPTAEEQEALARELGAAELAGSATGTGGV
ncbi:MAG TPA: S8 family peptidase [Vicinamibacterales bacterium]|nr:S8 family peptidase [Vicinamibacterales bacterium]